MKLLFLCSGNICRSPMAEAMAPGIGDVSGRIIEARSASTLGLADQPAHRHAVAVCREIDLDLSLHRAQPLTAELLGWADHVLAMELGHVQAAHDLGAEHAAKVHLLGPYAGVAEIEDPLRGWRRRFRATRDLLEVAINGFVCSLPKTSPP